MSGFAFRGGEWHAEELPLAKLAAEYGTPCYVYSQAVIEASARQLCAAFPQSRPRFFYAVKANDNLSILRLFGGLGFGFDIVSGGELARVLAAGGAPQHIVFSGVGKSADEMREALGADIGCFNVESVAEFDRLESIAAAANLPAPVAFRVTPNIDAETHPHLTTGTSGGKFGMPPQTALELARRAAASEHCRFLGFACHIGSQINRPQKYLAAAAAMGELLTATAAEGNPATHADMGGGFAVDYESSAGLCVPLAEYDRALATMAKQFNNTLQIWLEPGRALIAAAGVLLAQVEYVKHSGDSLFWVINAGMNDLPRPSLYDAYHAVEVVRPADAPPQTGAVAGPVCESADIIARNRTLPAAAGDILMVRDVGAYCAVMMSNYNSRPRPCEVLVDGGRAKLIRRRETIADMLAGEQSL